MASVRISTGSGSHLKLMTIYRSPNSTDTNNIALNDLIAKTDRRTILVGDFNYGNIDWGCLTAGDPRSRAFLDSCNEKFFVQHVNFATRKHRILDLVLSIDPDIVSDVNCPGKLGTSDHDAITFHINSAPMCTNPSKQKVPDFTKANWSALANELAARSWDVDFDGMNVDEMWLHFKRMLQEASEKHIPLITRRSRRRGPVCANDTSSRAVKVKQKLWKRHH